jgi:hypothetical protein
VPVGSDRLCGFFPLAQDSRLLCDHSNGILSPIKGGICIDSVTKVNLFLGRRIIYILQCSN